MKRTLVLINCFATATLALLGLSSVATAGTIYLDNSIDIDQYSLTVNPGTPVVFSTSQPGITDMAFTADDTNLSPQDVLLAASTAGIYAYSQSGVSSLFASVAHPVGLAIDGNGNVYVGANGGTILEELSPTGAFVKNIATTGIQAESLALDPAGDLFAADNNTGDIIEYLAGGGSRTYSSAPLDGADNFGMTFDAAGDLFVTYVSVCGGPPCGGIDEITPNGSISSFYSTNNPPGGVPDDVLPVGIAYDPNLGNLYMSYLDTSNGPGGGIEVFDGESATPSAFATVSSGFPGAIVDLAPEPGSIPLLGGGLVLTALLYFRRVRRLARAERDQV